MKRVDHAAASRPGRGSAPGLHVCFVPAYGDNPYQQALARHLQAHGVTVSNRGSVRSLPRFILHPRSAPDLIHLHWLPRSRPRIGDVARMAGFLGSLLVLRMLGRPVVWTAHNLFHHESSWRRGDWWTTRIVIGLASRVIAHSETAARLVAAEFHLRDDGRIAVVPHGNYLGAYPNALSPGAARARLGIGPAAVVLVFFGHIRRYKGVPELLAAFARLRDPDAVLVLAGKPVDAECVREAERAAAADSRIRLRTGFVPDEDVQLYMNAADAVIFPYQDVLTSGAVILAMSFARACVAPRLGCIPDLLDESGGILYDPDEPAALGRALARALEARRQLPEMGRHNLERAQAWDWEDIGRRTAEIYLAAADRRWTRTRAGGAQSRT